MVIFIHVVAIELKARSHRPVVATHEMYREKVEREGIEFAAVRPNLEDLGDEQVLMKKIMHQFTARDTS
ncbi:MAG: hypothetical protein U0892_12320 [Pirellulales bacterium]